MTTALPRSEIETEHSMGSRGPDTQRSALIALAIVAMMALSLVAHLGALHRDLPIPDTDEQDFVQPAVHIAATGDLDPHWFGHPGSTVIYPIAALLHVWDATLHDGPILGSNGALEARYHRTPAPFYLIGRIWTIGLGIAAIPVIYLLGSRAFRRRVGFIGAVLWAVLPYPI